jgi:hypothetical protein
MKQNTKIALAAGGGAISLIALYFYLTSQKGGEEVMGGGGGGGVSGGGGGEGLSLPDLLALIKKGGAGYTGPGAGPGGGAVVGGGGAAIEVPTTLSTVSKWGMAAQLAGNPYAPGYLQAVQATEWQAPSFTGKKGEYLGSGVLMPVSTDIIASANLKKSALYQTTEGPAAIVTGVTSQGIVQTTAGDFYTTGAKKGTAFKCMSGGVEIPCKKACHNAQGVEIPC